ncbi:HAD hydrolase-like protein [Streptomyces sp. NBC_01275]|nr:HAD hydrolase-like protein [Streptomyces sp. NBC_01275]
MAIHSADRLTAGPPRPARTRATVCGPSPMDVEPERCAVIEDSAYGVRAARAAGMRSFGYCDGVTPASRLEGPGAILFDDMRDLPKLPVTATH